MTMMATERSLPTVKTQFVYFFFSSLKTLTVVSTSLYMFVNTFIAFLQSCAIAQSTATISQLSLHHA